MVTGFKSFQEWFKGYEQQYTIIGPMRVWISVLQKISIWFLSLKQLHLNSESVFGNILSKQNMNIRTKTPAFHNFTDFLILGILNILL